MKLIAPALAAIAALTTTPALAQAPAPAAPATPSVSIENLLAAGYEVKAITDLTDEEQKAIWPNDSTEPYIMVTFEKTGSVAVCTLAMVNWINLPESTLSDTARCYEH